ncbi:hypothetical protein [Desulfopila aestuarii]|uniref:Uncharacterized protein n=1 Tax=Desulfopila aestuarii DSM 18488 TaxID=1121416 RepID=A0A1M7Y606_9BACT|nr:hypothetical protein [Desulfopila aestuarii]SHO48078.1 hypothetical protein SAMN02745220_02112 [Desulfopila aestuarii DSM 18488]
MAVYKKWQISVIIMLVLLLLGGLVVLLRPDLVPFDAFKRGMAVVSGYVTGQKVEKTEAGSPKNAVAVKKDIYRIDLKTGGRVYTDNLKKSDGTFTYTTASGLVVTIQGHEVMALKKFKEGEEPDN